MLLFAKYMLLLIVAVVFLELVDICKKSSRRRT